MFIGRTRELTELNRLYHSTRFQMAVIYGRRRIGKTRIIQEFIKDKKAVYMMAVESNLPANLELLSTAIYNAFQGETEAAAMPPFQSLENAFHYLTQKARQQKIIFVIDEYPYLAQAEKSVSSLLQSLIDQQWKQMNFMVILCGSSMSFMENQVLGYKSPLYGRRTAQFLIKPMDYYESSLFVPDYSTEEKAVLYGFTGGVPQYLEMVDGSASIKENLINLFLKPNAYLFEEPMNLIKQEMNEPANYNAIIEAIARGATKLNEISTKVMLETSNTSTYLKALIALGLVEKESAVTEKENRKKTSYRLHDQMFRFWYRYIPQSMFLIQSGKGERAYEKIIKPDLLNYMGGIFEKMCMQHIEWLGIQDQLPFDLMELGRWWGNNPVLKKQEEIDILAVNQAERKALLGECKYRNEVLDTDVIYTLQQRALLFPQFVNKYFIFYSKSGFSESALSYAQTHKEVRFVTLEEMYDRKEIS